MANDFHNLGIKQGEMLLVHSSLSSIGFVVGSSEAVVLALLQVVGNEGTIIMPSQTMQNSNPEDWENPPVPNEWHHIIYDELPVYDSITTPTCMMGAIAETFRTFPGTKRSNHPQTSFCANGKYAYEITCEHELTPQFGTKTPLGKMYNYGAKVLLIGVNYNKCTCFHMSETLSGVLPKEKNGAAILKNNTREWVWYNDVEWNTDDFIMLGNDFEAKQTVKKGFVGNAECKLFDLRAAVDYGTEWIKENRASYLV